MDTIKYVLLERPWPVYLAGSVVVIVLLGLWVKYRRHKLLWRALVVAAVAGAIGLLAHFVDTDGEKIAMSLERMARDVEAGRIAAIKETLDEDCRGLKMSGITITKAQLLLFGKMALGVNKITSVNFVTIETDTDGDKATSEVATNIFTDHPDQLGRPAGVVWRLQWIKRPAGWRILQVEIIDSKPQSDDLKNFKKPS